MLDGTYVSLSSWNLCVVLGKVGFILYIPLSQVLFDFVDLHKLHSYLSLIW